MKSIEIANALIARHGGEMTITNLKLNKLVYFAQVEHLRKFDVALFDDAIEAWQFGPVEPVVYHKFKGFGRKKITQPEALDVRAPSNVVEIIDYVADAYGKLSAFDLVNFSHRPGGAWSSVYDPDDDREITIADILASEDMKGIAGFGKSVESAMSLFADSIPNAMRMLENG